MSVANLRGASGGNYPPSFRKLSLVPPFFVRSAPHIVTLRHSFWLCRSEFGGQHTNHDVIEQRSQRIFSITSPKIFARLRRAFFKWYFGLPPWRLPLPNLGLDPPRFDVLSFLEPKKIIWNFTAIWLRRKTWLNLGTFSIKSHTNAVTTTVHVKQFFRYTLTGLKQFWAQGPKRIKCGPVRGQ